MTIRSRRTPSPAVVGTALAGTLFLTAGVQTAYADLWGADIPLLTGLVAQATNTINVVSEQLKTMRETYDEAKRLAGYAEDAQRAYQYFANFNARRFGEDVLQTIDGTFPDIGYFRREASRTGPWAQGTGELQSLVSMCFNGLGKGKGCVELREALSLQQARAAIEGTFGTAPPMAGAIEARAVDYEASLAMAASASQFERNKLTRNESDALLRECAEGGSEKNLAACQAAAGTAQIRQLRASADMADQLAEANRLQAVELSQNNARRKRELSEALERRKLLLEGAKALEAEPVRVQTEGIPLFSEGR